MADPTLIRLADHLGEDLLKAFKPKGYYVMDERECATRRVDLNVPEDEDPGPIPMEPADEDEPAIVLRFGEPQS
ncbi:MAG: hypothetical protein KC912_13645 [Proteobacteria bacterium]|nr:hypothetical protein [Pseudomonadota bacterium]